MSIEVVKTSDGFLKKETDQWGRIVNFHYKDPELKILHRLNDKPAIYGDKYKISYWYVNGLLHRENDKSCNWWEYAGVNWWDEEWRIHGVLHRLSGPAKIHHPYQGNRSPQDPQFWIGGVQLSQEEHAKIKNDPDALKIWGIEYENKEIT